MNVCETIEPQTIVIRWSQQATGFLYLAARSGLDDAYLSF